MSISKQNILDKEKKIKQALIVCDNFENTFQPIQSEQELPFLKLVNWPLIEYTLTFLKNSGIEQIIIFSSNSNKLKNYLEEKKWIQDKQDLLSIVVINSESLTSLGDVLREAFNNSLIKNDFVLLNGNIIGNIPLLNYLDEHIKKRLNEDKGLVMSMIFNEMNFDHRSKTKDSKLILVLDKVTNKLLFYENCLNNKKKIQMKLEMFQNNTNNLNIRFDLQDTNISICSAAVPQLFADNFDYSTKEDLIRGILVHEEILGNSIYIETCTGKYYGAKVYDSFSFDAINRDIIQRWTFPLVPEIQQDLCFQRHNIYKSSTVDLKINSVLKKNLAIGKKTSINYNVFIEDSVIGDNCKIGKNVNIVGSYILDNVIIEDDCDLNMCILSNNVKVKKNSKINQGCILAQNVIVGPNVNLPKCTILEAAIDSQEKPQVDLVGLEGKGNLYKPNDNSDEDEEVCNVECWGNYSESDSESDLSQSSFGASITSNSEIEDAEDDHVDYETKIFYNEVMDSLQRGLEERIDCKNLILEINCSKHAYNIPIKELVCLVVEAILDLPTFMNSNIEDQKSYFVQFQKILLYYLPLFQNYVKVKESQKDCLLTLEYFALSKSDFFSVNILVKILSYLYDKEVLEEEVLLNWYRNQDVFPFILGNSSNLDRKKFRNQDALKDFIKWLIEAEEESSDEDAS